MLVCNPVALKHSNKIDIKINVCSSAGEDQAGDRQGASGDGPDGRPYRTAAAHPAASDDEHDAPSSRRRHACFGLLRRLRTGRPTDVADQRAAWPELESVPV